MKLLQFGILSAAIAVSPASVAGDDPAHPAYDYEQSVIYPGGNEAGKESAPAGSSQQTEADAKYPGAYFTPHVIYSDEQAAK